MSYRRASSVHAMKAYCFRNGRCARIWSKTVGNFPSALDRAGGTFAGAMLWHPSLETPCISTGAPLTRDIQFWLPAVSRTQRVCRETAPFSIRWLKPGVSARWMSRALIASKPRRMTCLARGCLGPHPQMQRPRIRHPATRFVFIGWLIRPRTCRHCWSAFPAAESDSSSWNKDT